MSRTDTYTTIQLVINNSITRIDCSDRIGLIDCMDRNASDNLIGCLSEETVII